MGKGGAAGDDVQDIGVVKRVVEVRDWSGCRYVIKRRLSVFEITRLPVGRRCYIPDSNRSIGTSCCYSAGREPS